MRTIQVSDKKFKISIPQSEIQKRVAILADLINQAYEGQELFVISVLNGSFMFAADLVRKIKVPCQVSFVKEITTHDNQSTEEVMQLIGLNDNIKGKHVLVIEDIIETGNTMRFVLNYLKAFKPSDVKIAALLVKTQAFLETFHVDYVGFELVERFVVGYGFDYNGYGRNLEDIYEMI